MRVGDDGPIRGTPGIDVEIAARAVQAVLVQFQDAFSIGDLPARVYALHWL